MCAVILGPKKGKFVSVSVVSPSICHEVMGPDAIRFLNVEFEASFFNPPLSLLSRGSLVPLYLLP